MTQADHAADDRLELAMHAARAERRSRPVHLLVLAALVLVAAAVYLALSYASLGRASASLAAVRASGTEAVTLAHRLAALKALETGASGPRAFERMENLRTEIERRARDAGFKNTGPMTPRSINESPAGVRGAMMRRLEYNVRAETLPVLMDWMQRCVREINGLEVYALTLIPETDGWSLKVTFSRWERREES